MFKQACDRQRNCLYSDEDNYETDDLISDAKTSDNEKCCGKINRKFRIDKKKCNKKCLKI